MQAFGQWAQACLCSFYISSLLSLGTFGYSAALLPPSSVHRSRWDFQGILSARVSLPPSAARLQDCVFVRLTASGARWLENNQTLRPHTNDEITFTEMG